MVVPGGVDRSGTERVIPVLLAMIERIAAWHELHVFALTQEPEPARWRLRGAIVHNAGHYRPRRRALHAIVAEHRRGYFRVLHGVWAGPGFVAGLAGRLIGVPALLHLVGGDVAAVPEIGYGLASTLRGRTWLRAAVAMAKHVTANSTYAVDLAARRGICAERVPYGVSVREWRPVPPRRREPAEPARLLFVASLNRVKDPETAIRGVAVLRRRGIPFRLDVIGVDLLDGACQRLADELGVGDAVHFHGFLPQRALRPWMERADALLVTSLHECGPIVAMEAALCGVPTVGTRVGHLADWAPDACVPIPMRDPEALADAVAGLLADEDRRLRIASAAQARAQADDADRAAARVLAIYDALARGESPVPSESSSAARAADASRPLHLP
jgi:glycosyltransferase involved in cell wall biosynthesis